MDLKEARYGVVAQNDLQATAAAPSAGPVAMQPTKAMTAAGVIMQPTVAVATALQPTATAAFQPMAIVVLPVTLQQGAVQPPLQHAGAPVGAAVQTLQPELGPNDHKDLAALEAEVCGLGVTVVLGLESIETEKRKKKGNSKKKVKSVCSSIGDLVERTPGSNFSIVRPSVPLEEELLALLDAHCQEENQKIPASANAIFSEFY